MKYIKNKIVSVSKIISIIILLFSFASCCIIPSMAVSKSMSFVVKQYEFDGSTDYTITGSKTVSSDSTYGTFSIAADVLEESTKNGIPSYVVKGDNLGFFYNYSDSLLKESEEKWYLTNDKCKSVDGKKLDDKVQKGYMLLQVSNDRKNWIDVFSETNAFENTPIRTNAFYKGTDIQLMNGCYYKLTIAYELQKFTGKNWLGISNYEYKRFAEVYEIYVRNDKYTETEIDTNRIFYLGSKVKAADFDSYSGAETIEKSDPHYGWDLGKFFISGHTNTVKDTDGTVVIMKNVGDEITLWFKLEQNIDALNGDSKLSINADDNWYDREYETERTNSGRGVLIVKHTDYKNESRTVLYTDYLASSASIGANTKVQIFEEGDYEVTLDYEIREDKLIDRYHHYRISFKFLIRNGNCMVYPLDVATGGELTNGALTEKGFTLDLAKSRYLNIVVKKEILTEGADGLIEDTRFNKIARDGEVFDDEGIYTITVKNLYSGADPTVKKIYVGSNPLLKALVINPQYSLSDIKSMVSKGATISDQGIITIGNYNTSTQDETEPIWISPTTVIERNQETTEEATEQQGEINMMLIIICIVGGVIFILVIVCIALLVNKSKKKKAAKNNGGVQE